MDLQGLQQWHQLVELANQFQVTPPGRRNDPDLDLQGLRIVVVAALVMPLARNSASAASIALLSTSAAASIRVLMALSTLATSSEPRRVRGQAPR